MPSGGYPEIPGLYFVYTTGRTRRPECSDLPFKLEVRLWHPVNVVWAVSHGRADEHIVVQARTRVVLEEQITQHGFRGQPRLILLVLTGPQGEIERIEHQDRIHPITGVRVQR